MAGYPHQAWVCSRCTYQNQQEEDVCSMCLGPRTQASQSQDRLWTCQFCTLMNAQTLLVCEACDNPRHSAGGSGNIRLQPPPPAEQPPSNAVMESPPPAHNPSGGQTRMYHFIRDAQQQPIVLTIASQTPYGWLKDELARRFEARASAAIKIFDFQAQERHGSAGETVFAVLGDALYWQVKCDEAVIGRQLTVALDDVILQMEYVTMQNAPRTDDHAIRLLREGWQKQGSMLSKLVNAWVTFRGCELAYVTYEQAAPERIDNLRAIIGAAGTGVQDMFFTFLKSRLLLNDAAIGSAKTALVQLGKSVRADKLPSFFAKYGDMMSGIGDTVAGGMNLARACLSLVGAMKLREQSKEAYDEITDFIFKNLCAVISGVRGLAVLVDKIWENITQQHQSFDSLAQRQILTGRYDNLAASVVQAMLVMEQWFLQQEEGLKRLAKFQEEQLSAAQWGAVGSAVSIVINGITFFRGSGLVRVLAGLSGAMNLASFTLDMTVILKVLPEARANVDAAKQLVEKGHEVVKKVKVFVMDCQGWHTRENLIRDEMRQQFLSKSEELAYFIENTIGRPVDAPNDLNAVDSAFRSLNRQRIPVVLLRGG